MIKPLEELSDQQLLDIIARHNLNTLAVLQRLDEMRQANELLQQELKRRVARNEALPGAVAQELARIGEKLGG